MNPVRSKLPKETADSQKAKRTSSGMKKILLLEPNAPLGRVYAAALAKHGYKVSWQKNAQEAIHEADQNKPDVVIAELQLAGHNGIEFLYELRSYSDWQSVPVIVLSHVPEPKPALASRLKVAAYLYKPRTSLEQLVASVGNVLAAQQA